MPGNTSHRIVVSRRPAVAWVTPVRVGDIFHSFACPHAAIGASGVASVFEKRAKLGVGDFKQTERKTVADGHVMGWAFIAFFADATVKAHDEGARRDHHHLRAIGTIGKYRAGFERHVFSKRLRH